MIILDGKLTSEKLKSEVKAKLDAYYASGAPGMQSCHSRRGREPRVRSVRSQQNRSCAAVGIGNKVIALPESSTQEEVNEAVKKLAEDKSVHGILVQLPLPNGLDGDEATSLVPVEKDVDGFTAESLGRLITGEEGFLSCTPGGIVYLLKNYGIELKGKKAVIIGRSKIVGKRLRSRC